jgi:glycosyltransferase involved in cell wall biosynthesis
MERVSVTSGEQAELQTPDVEISVVLPVLNEAANVPAMCQQLHAVLAQYGPAYEVIFVGGGSTDGTELAVLRAREADRRIKLLWLSRNFGHQEALTAGLDHAAGRAVITMDGDLQHPPAVIPQLVEAWRQGYDIVTTSRVSTAQAGILKRTTSRWFYALLNRLSDLELEEGSADFRLLSRPALDAIKQMPERSRFLRGMVHWIGFEQARVQYHAAPRQAGRTKYSAARLLRFALMATVSFSATPLFVMAGLGLLFAGLSFIYGVFAIVARLFSDIPIAGWASVLAGLMFIGGLQLTSTGLVGIYIAKIFEEAKARPVYLVRQGYGFNEAPPPPMHVNTEPTSVTRVAQPASGRPVHPTATTAALPAASQESAQPAVSNRG